jgi:hypothetical protein
MCLEGGPCLPLYIRGDRVTWKVLAEYSWSPTTTQSGSFLCTAASSTPIRVIAREVWYIHELSLTLEYSMPISSPTAPGLTSPRALRSRVMQASNTLAGRLQVLQVFFWAFLQVQRVVLQVLQNILIVASGPSFRFIE